MDQVELMYHHYQIITNIFHENKKNVYIKVIVASLNGNKDALGLPDAKLIVEGGDRANN
jgi:hypothetical protein